MFGLGLPEFLLILVLVLLLFGLKRWPGFSKDVKKSSREFSDKITDAASNESLKTVTKDVGDTARKLKDEATALKKSLYEEG